MTRRIAYVGFKRTAVCVIDEAGAVIWRGVVDTHPEIAAGFVYQAAILDAFRLIPFSPAK